VYEVSTGVRSTRNKDGGIVLDIERGQMFRLNPVGALILESLASGSTEEEISRELSRLYGISEENTAADVREFLESLERHKLIQAQQRGKAS
jgi:Coenzyme PQQ synthesis protein D (PqqD)